LALSTFHAFSRIDYHRHAETLTDDSTGRLSVRPPMWFDFRSFRYPELA
jgi:hypothetical protein